MSEKFQLGQDWVAKVTTASGDELSVMGADRPTLARVPRIIFKGHVGEFVDASDYDDLAAQLAETKEVLKGSITLVARQKEQLTEATRAINGNAEVAAIIAENRANDQASTLRAERDALAQQLQQAQADLACMVAPEERDQWKRAYEQAQAERDRWALNYNMAQADLARARWVYEADILRLTGERDELQSTIDLYRSESQED